MMHDSSENDQLSYNRIIGLNQEFPLFPSNTSIVADESGKMVQYNHGVDLSLPQQSSNLHIDIFAQKSRAKKAYTLTPYSTKGYQVSHHDFNFITRQRSYREQRRHNQYLSEKVASYYLYLKIPVDSLLQAGLSYVESGEGHRRAILLPYARRFIEDLRLQLSFPQMQLEGQALKNGLDNNEVLFGRFYPTDTGELATHAHALETEMGFLDKGLSVFLPPDFLSKGPIVGLFTSR